MSGFSISSSLPLAGLSTDEQQDFQKWLADQASGGGKGFTATTSMDDIFSQSATADIALGLLADKLQPQLQKGATPTKDSLAMLAVLLANTQKDLDDALFQGTDSSWIAQEDASQRASDQLGDLQKQYGFINYLQ